MRRSCAICGAKMIWASDAQGRATYLSPEWLTLTGQAVADATGWGWLTMVHPDDRETVRAAVSEASRAASAFTVTYRLFGPDGGHIWVTGGAMPSFSPQDGRFLGFLGSLSQAPCAEKPGAESRVQIFDPPPPGTLSGGRESLDLIADHLLIARALAARAGEEMLRSIIDVSLLETGQRLARSERSCRDAALN